MATLVSPGVSVTIIDESFYIPASAPTVPLFFVATRQGKMQPDGITPANGTNEHSVVRTVTSLGQSTQLYGIPYFWESVSGLPYHGDSRNEYGLFALNQYLGVGNRAYVVRANINLNDETVTFVRPELIVHTSPTFVGVGNGVISVNDTFLITETDNRVVETLTVTCVAGGTSPQFIVEGSQSGLIGNATITGPAVNFSSTRVKFTLTKGLTDFQIGDKFVFNHIYGVDVSGVVSTGNGTVDNLVADANAIAEDWTITFTSATTFDVTGSLTGPTLPGGVVGIGYDNNFINFTINAGTNPFATGDEILITLITKTIANPLGVDDDAKRVSIVEALAAEINSNTEVRSERYEYNIILCPGYHELADEMLALSTAVFDEAFVICDSPVTKTAEETAVWAMTSERKRSTNIAYYYPWCLASNLDGANVVSAPSGTALRTYAYSDNQTYVWFAPAGVNRGLVTGVDKVGYVSGELGGPTTFEEVSLNQGQRDILYEFDKNINPITFFPGRGIIIWGQKTSAAAASALDRVNVVRLLMYVKRALRKGAFPFVFEPNDQITRDNLKSAVDGFLNDVMIKRGLYDFATLCDASNNTPDRIDRNELWLDVAVKPVKAAEFIYIPIRVLSTGASL